MKSGDAICYKSMAGDMWSALLLCQRIDGTVDIEVDGLILTRIPTHAGDDFSKCPRRHCLVKEPHGQASKSP